MRTSLEWIRSMVPELSCTAQEYMDAMTLSGSKVEGYEELDADLEKIVIGQIEKIEKHKGHVSGSTGIWNLYLPGRCSGWSRCSRSTRTSQFRI